MDDATAYRASVVLVLGWLWAIVGRAWPHVFDRGAVRSGERVREGIRVGRSILYEPPWPAALVVALVATTPRALGASLGDAWIAPVTFVAAFVVLGVWLFAPPGTRMLAGAPADAAPPVPPHRRALRAVLVLALSGVAPAALLALALERVLRAAAS